VTRRNRQPGHLTDLQQAILDLLWKHGPATAEQIREGLHPKHRLKDSSVRTLLRRLEARGFLSHHAEGKVFVYRTELPSQSVAARAVRQIIDRLCAGSTEQFLVGMVDERVISPGDLQRLARKVKAR
jgi:predicted transcriptional regulator